MKYFSVLLLSLFLSACSSTPKVVPEETKPEPPKLNVLTEVCLKPSKKITLSLITTERSGSDISAHTYQAELKSKNNIFIYSALLGFSKDLTYFTIENFLDPTTYFLMKRDFSHYKINEWSIWEDPDYLFKEGTQYKFIPLSTSIIDSTNKLLKIKFTKQDPVKVRFKLVNASEYINNLNNELFNPQEINSCVN